MNARYCVSITRKEAFDFLKAYIGNVKLPAGAKYLWVAGMRYTSDQPGLYLIAGSTGMEGVMVIKQKPCNTCGVMYPATNEHFHINNRSPDGLQHQCKACKAEYRKVTYIPKERTKRPVRQTIDVGVPGVIGIQATRGLVGLVDEIDSDLAQFNWYYSYGYLKRDVYENDMKVGREIMHVSIAERMLDRKLTEDEEVDHRDRNRANNRRENLRVTTHIQNCWNSKKPTTNTSGLKGASLNKRTGRYVGQIVVAGVPYHLGYFGTAEEAHEAYMKKAIELRGEYARGD